MGKCNYDEQQKVTFCACETGFLGKKCAVMCAKDRQGRVCSGNGLCAPDGAEQAKCICKAGFLGSDCAMKCKTDVMGRVCGGNKQGTCVKDGDKGTTMCKCKKGYLGADCNVKCPVQGDNVCNSHGTCFLDSKTKKAKCVCEKGLLGVIAPTNAQVVLMEMCAMVMASAHQIRRLGKLPAHALARSLVQPVSITALGVRNQTVRYRVMDMENAH